MASIDIRLPPKWIELNVTKRECSCFICTAEDDSLCQCGRRKIEHVEEALHKRVRLGESWTPSLHTSIHPTDAYGTIIFEGEHHPNKAHYVRLSYDSSPDLVIQLMTLVWGIEMPKLVITVCGGDNNFELYPRIGKILQVGLIKAAKSTGAWILTTGINRGVTRHVGNALSNERWLFGFKRGRVVSVGIAPWGVVEHRNELLGRNRERVYNPIEHPNSKFVLLNPRHSNFLLVDNGSVGKLGGEKFFRKRLEKCLESYPTSPHRGCDTPLICIVIEGGFYTLRTIGDYLNDEPPVPVLVFGGTGRTADLIIWLFKKLETSDETMDDMKDEIFKFMIRMYRINPAQCIVLMSELKRIVAKKNLVTIYNPHQSEEESFDTVILAAIFRSQHWSPLQQLSLTLVWDRVDIANGEVFVYGRDWSKENLEHAMMEALVSDRLDFVNLLLEHGLNMQTFLSPQRLEALYTLEKTHSKVMRSLLCDLAKIRSIKSKQNKNGPPGMRTIGSGYDRTLTLHDVGLAFSQMMGHLYKSNYLNIMRTTINENVDGDDDDDNLSRSFFERPFDELFVWSVLTKRHKMALLLWRHGPGPLAKSLVAVKLNKYLTTELASTERTETNLAAEFQGYAEEWENLSLQLLDSCFRNDPVQARQLLTMDLRNWSSKTCLTLAVMANHRMLLGHPCCQMLLADLWMGALNLKRNASLKILLGIFFPPLTFLWDYKSTEELKLLPHPEEKRAQRNLTNGAGLGPSSQVIEESESLRTFHSRASFMSFFRKKKTKSDKAMAGAKRNKKTEADLNLVSQVLEKFPYETNKKKPQPQHHHHHHHPIVEDEGKGENNDEVVIKGKGNAPILTIAIEKLSTAGIDSPANIGRQIEISNTPNTKYNPSLDVFGQGETFQEEYRNSFVTTTQELSYWNKLYEFQKAPVTNFYRHTLAYIIFVCCLSYTILVPQDKYHPGYVELYTISYLATFGCEIIRDFLSIDAYNLSQKWSEFRNSVWMLSDFGAILFFMVGVGLRFEGFFNYGMLLYRISSIYWNLRLYKYMGVHKFVGPKIVMMSRMIKHMAYFTMIIFVVLISFGIAREAIRFPDHHPEWRNIAEAFLEPYVMMFGEVDIDALSPQCGEEGQIDCPVGYWIVPITWAIYMLVANILIVNVLIAVFNGIYSEIDAIALELWMFQRYTFVMEFEQKPLIPPPFIIISHIYYILRWAWRKIVICVCEEEIEVKGVEYEEGRRVIMGADHSVKTFLSPTQANIVIDFEEDNMDGINTGVIYGENGKVVKERGFNETTIGPTSGTSALPDQRALQQITQHVRDLFIEMESQKNKLDRLIEFWEVRHEEDSMSNSGNSYTRNN